MQNSANYRKKNLLYSLFLILALLGVWVYRNYIKESERPEAEGKKVELQGRTMGTTYSVKYLDAEERNFQPGIDSLLEAFNLSLSTYIPESEISRFNKEALLKYESPFFTLY